MRGEASRRSLFCLLCSSFWSSLSFAKGTVSSVVALFFKACACSGQQGTDRWVSQAVSQLPGGQLWEGSFCSKEQYRDDKLSPTHKSKPSSFRGRQSQGGGRALPPASAGAGTAALRAGSGGRPTRLAVRGRWFCAWFADGGAPARLAAAGLPAAE